MARTSHAHRPSTPVSLLTVRAHQSLCSPPEHTSLSAHRPSTPVSLLTTRAHQSLCSPPEHTSFSAHRPSTPVSLLTTLAHQSLCSPSVNTSALLAAALSVVSQLKTVRVHRHQHVHTCRVHQQRDVIVYAILRQQVVNKVNQDMATNHLHQQQNKTSKITKLT